MSTATSLAPVSTVDGHAPSGSRSGGRYVVMHPRGERKGLFWITPDAPQSTAFRELGREQQIVCLRSPTQPDDLPPLTLGDLATYYADSIDEFPVAEPISLVGYCIAAVVAREVAIEVESRGRRVRSLIMIDPPDLAKSKLGIGRDPPSYRVAQEMRRWSFHLRRLCSRHYGGPAAYVRDSLRGVLARLRYRRSGNAFAVARFGGGAMPEAFSDGYHLAVAAFLNSTPEPYRGTACIIRPTDLPAKVFARANMRWRALVAGGVRFVDVPGNSTTMWQEPAVKALANEIRACLSPS